MIFSDNGKNIAIWSTLNTLRVYQGQLWPKTSDIIVPNKLIFFEVTPSNTKDEFGFVYHETFLLKLQFPL